KRWDRQRCSTSATFTSTTLPTSWWSSKGNRCSSRGEKHASVRSEREHRRIGVSSVPICPPGSDFRCGCGSVALGNTHLPSQSRREVHSPAQFLLRHQPCATRLTTPPSRSRRQAVDRYRERHCSLAPGIGTGLARWHARGSSLRGNCHLDTVAGGPRYRAGVL